jgi:predicted CoA-binding protein
LIGYVRIVVRSTYDEFLSGEPVAVIGASDRRGNFGAAIYRALREKSYDVYPVNPNADTVAGDRCYGTIDDIPTNVTSAIIAVSPTLALSMIEALSSGGVRKIWFQRGADFRIPALRARELGMQTFEGRCILMHTDSVRGVHAVHRFLAKITGNL